MADGIGTGLVDRQHDLVHAPAGESPAPGEAPDQPADGLEGFWIRLHGDAYSPFHSPSVLCGPGQPEYRKAIMVQSSCG